MESQIRGAVVHYVEHGDGVPIVALHGAGVDHREIEAALEAVVPGTGYRRIYPDLPGMGHSTAEGLTGNDDVVALIGDFIDQLGEHPVLLIGHSYGAYVARGLASKRPDLVLGLALICPFGEGTGELPDHEVARQDDSAYRQLPAGYRTGFDEYFVVRTPATADRYRDHVVPGTTLVDETALERVFGGWTIELGEEVLPAHTLIVAGRSDSTAGYTAATDLALAYPLATLAVIANAGHAVMHERPELFGALVRDWLDRARGIS